MPSSVSCIQTSFLLHRKHAYSPPQRCCRGKGRFRHQKRCKKTRFRTPPLHFPACWWPSTQASLLRQSGPQTPGILPSLPLLSLFDPHFRGKRQFEKKNGFDAVVGGANTRVNWGLDNPKFSGRGTGARSFFDQRCKCR
jgi:hypothetical protein